MIAIIIIIIHSINKPPPPRTYSPTLAHVLSPLNPRFFRCKMLQFVLKSHPVPVKLWTAISGFRHDVNDICALLEIYAMENPPKERIS
jgi:hypothetical protein